MSYLKLAIIGVILLIAGMMFAEAPSFYQDLRFLHAARLFNEADAARAAAQKQQQAPNGVIDQSQVHPVPPAEPPKK